jgi:hypothetical protein
VLVRLYVRTWLHGIEHAVERVFGSLVEVMIHPQAGSSFSPGRNGVDKVLVNADHEVAIGV